MERYTADFMWLGWVGIRLSLGKMDCSACQGTLIPQDFGCNCQCTNGNEGEHCWRKVEEVKESQLPTNFVLNGKPGAYHYRVRNISKDVKLNLFSVNNDF